MKLLKLEILSLASLDNQDGEVINFEEGALGESTIFSIVGPMGSGKSTLLDAICLALYNRAPRYPRKKGDKNQNIEVFGMPDEGERNRLAPTDSRNILTRGRRAGYSKLTFLANDGQVYRAEWHVRFQRVRYDSPDTRLYRLTKSVGRQQEEAADWNELPQIIGLDYDQFLRTVLIAQGSFANFLNAKENERYELLEKLIGCEETYTAIAYKIKARKDAAVEAYNTIQAEVEAVRQHMLTDEQLAQTLAKVLSHHPDEEICVTFEFRSREAQPLIDKGQVVARQQFVVQPYAFPTLKAEQAPVTKEETNSYVKLEAAGTTLTIGKWTGWIDYIDVDGAPMLVDHESVTPEFWRAPTDNDYGARLQMRFAAWKNPEMKLTDCKVNDNQVVASFDLPGVKGKLTMTYTLTAEGEVIVREQFTADQGAEVSPMFRYGMQLQMPKQFCNVKYYGRGPIENYSDRNSSEFLGVYENKVADEYYPYVRPQESGNHTDIRWFRVLDGQGRGLEFYADAPFEASALNYLTADLDDGPTKDKVVGSHSGDLVERPLTQVHIQKRQMGLGCVNSWGAWPLDAYVMKYGDYDFTFAIRPVR